MKKYEGKSFELLGVNCDPNRQTVQQLYDKGTVTWRSFLIGHPSSNPPALRNYRIEGFPTIYVIDQNGVVRHEGLIGPDLEKAVDRLLAQGGKS